MNKVVDYSVAGGSALLGVTGAVTIFKQVKKKNWGGVLVGALTVAISSAAFNYSLNKLKSEKDINVLADTAKAASEAAKKAAEGAKNVASGVQAATSKA